MGDVIFAGLMLALGRKSPESAAVRVHLYALLSRLPKKVLFPVSLKAREMHFPSLRDSPFQTSGEEC